MSRRQSRAKKTKTTTTKAPKAPLDRYALMWYLTSKSIGVVSREDLKNGKVGSVVDAPNPIDWEPRDGRRFKAKIVRFGHSIEFLYSLQISEVDGSEIPFDNKENIPVAITRYSQLKTDFDRKAQTLSKLNGSVMEMTPLSFASFGKVPHNSPTVQGSAASVDLDPSQSTSSAENQGNLTLSQVPQNSPTVQGSAASVDLDPLPSTSAENQENLTLSQVLQNSLLEQHSPINMVIDLSTMSEENREKNTSAEDLHKQTYTQTNSTPFFKVNQSSIDLSGAAGSGINEVVNQNPHCIAPKCLVGMPFLDIATMSCPSGSHSCPFIETMKSASEDNIQFVQALTGAVLAHCQLARVSNDHQPLGQPLSPMNFQQLTPMSQRAEMPPIECTNPTGKLPLVEDIPIFLKKCDILSIPWVVPRPPETPKGQRKPPENPDALYPRGMVLYLLQKLVPEREILKQWTGQTIPQELYTAVKSYINFRMDMHNKLSDTTITEFITDCIRGKKRLR